MITDIFINGCILIASVSLGNMIFKETGFNPKVELKSKLFQGTLAGLLGIILMLFTVHINTTTILDFRNIAIILSALYGGFISATITGLIILFVRISFWGISKSAILAVLNILIMSLGCGFIAEKQLDRHRKWFLVTLFSLAITCISFYLLFKNIAFYINIGIPFILATCLLCFILFYYTKQLELYNVLFNRFKKEATVDFLTGLNNVREFDKMLNISFLNAKERNEKLSLLFLDIDYFKKINDTYGHIEGDEILKQLGRLLKSACRSFDYVFRNGGEEFSIILLNCPSEQAVEVAERIRTAVERYSFILTSGQTIKVTISIGVATYPENVSSLENLTERADQALYQAKQSCRNKVFAQIHSS